MDPCSFLKFLVIGQHVEICLGVGTIHIQSEDEEQLALLYCEGEVTSPYRLFSVCVCICVNSLTISLVTFMGYAGGNLGIIVKIATMHQCFIL